MPIKRSPGVWPVIVQNVEKYTASHTNQPRAPARMPASSTLPLNPSADRICAEDRESDHREEVCDAEIDRDRDRAGHEAGIHSRGLVFGHSSFACCPRPRLMMDRAKRSTARSATTVLERMPSATSPAIPAV